MGKSLTAQFEAAAALGNGARWPLGLGSPRSDVLGGGGGLRLLAGAGTATQRQRREANKKHSSSSSDSDSSRQPVTQQEQANDAA